MKRVGIFCTLIWLSLTLTAQVQDASSVYADFSKFASVIQTADPESPEYEIAEQTMLYLFPQLQYHAAKFSQSNQTATALTFAKAYVDMAMMPQFRDMHLELSEPYPPMTYFVASNFYNRKEYEEAVKYLQRYIELGTPKTRAVVYFYLAMANEKLGDVDEELAILDIALKEFPHDQDLLALAINRRMSKGWYAETLKYIDRALVAKPNDDRLMSLKGQCFEGMQRYEEALLIYSQLAERQKTLNIYRHYAVNLYNCAVKYYPTDQASALSYFKQAVPVLTQVVANDPTSVPYTTALAMAYLYTDQYSKLAETNIRLRKMGAPEVASQRAAQPQFIASDMPRLTQAPVALAQAEEQPQPEEKPKKEEKPKSEYQEFLQNYVEKEIALWQEKDPFETISEYKERVTEATRDQKIRDLLVLAKNKYIAGQKKQLRINDFKLQPYDAENRVFLIESPYGDLVLPVPRENNEARNLAASWKEVRIENPEFDIANEEMVIREADFVTRSGKVYHYSDADDARYSQVEIMLQFDDIDYSGLGGTNSNKRNNVQVQKSTVAVGNSDVDINIPESRNTHSNRFAFLIGNENYQLIAPVPFALHDVRIMKEYCRKTLGIPSSNIRVYENATFGKMLACVRDIKTIADAYNGDLDIIFYYAGHGVPDEASRSAYLLPTDADGLQVETCYPIGRLYQELGQLGAKSVVVLMDACFSGSQRGEGMLASARGVALKPKQDNPQGKMVTFSAASGEETAFPYEEQQHGMFTYYLLKALQESKGRISLGELTDYVRTQVKQHSVVINHKPQTPSVTASAEASDWRKWNWK